MNERLKALAAQFPQHEVDAYLITDDASIRYLTRFPASDSWLLVLPRRAYYLTDARYTQEARQGLQGVTVRECRRSLAQDLLTLLARQGAKRLALDERSVSHSFYKQLRAACPADIHLVAWNEALEAMRLIKFPEEIAQIRSCLDLNFKAYRYLKKFIRPGVSERDLLLRVEAFVRARGAGFSFPPIIASGPNGSFPHARVSDRKVLSRDVVLIDMGIEQDGYKSDLTRMFFVGKIQPFIQEVTDAVAKAQQAAIAVIRPGVPVAEADRQARNYLKSKGLAKYFTHSLGHGVGLDIHEPPRLSVRSTEIFREGMVVTIEPGVYFPGRFGVRIEDMILVTREGCEVLSAGGRI